MNVDRQVEAIIAAGIPLGEAEARVVAGWWHGGQGSASSAHADKRAMARELRFSAPARGEDLDALVAYVDALPDVALTASFDSRAEYDAIVYGTRSTVERNEAAIQSAKQEKAASVTKRTQKRSTPSPRRV